jgi:hypothetical protein
MSIQSTTCSSLLIDQYGYIHGWASLDGLADFVLKANQHHSVKLGPVTEFSGIGTGSVISFVNGSGDSVPISNSVQNGETITTIGFIWLPEQSQVKSYVKAVSTIKPRTQYDPSFFKLERQHAVFSWKY